VLLPFGGGSRATLEPSAAAAALTATVHPAAGSAHVRSAEAYGPGRAPRGLARRGRPPVAPPRPRPDMARWLVVAGGALAVFGLRRRALAAAVAGLGAALLIWLLPSTPLVGRTLRGIDADLARDIWLEVRSGNGTLAVPVGAECWFESRAPEPPRWTLTGRGPALSAPRADLHALCSIPGLTLDPDSGMPAEALERLWLRTPDGRWTAHDAWRPGDPFPPPALSASSGPPGWLAAGLPQGVRVLVGFPAGPGAPDWLRVTGTPGLESSKRR